MEARTNEFNPIARIDVLARAPVPAALIHGDVDKVVPLAENSAEFVRRYKEAGAESLVKLIVLEGQGHNFFEGFFHSQELVDFGIVRARAGSGAPKSLCKPFDQVAVLLLSCRVIVRAKPVWQLKHQQKIDYDYSKQIL